MTPAPKASRFAGGSVLAETAARADALGGYLSYRAGRPKGPGWYPLSALVVPEVPSAWREALTARWPSRRVAASFLAGWLTAAATDVWVLPALAMNRLPLVGPAEAAIHRHQEGWFDAVAVTGGRLAVLPDDPAAGLPGTVVLPDRSALVDALAAALLSLAPVLQSVRAGCGTGETVLWGMVADRVAARSLELARAQGRDRPAAWADAMALLERLAARQPRLRSRPRLFWVTYGGGRECFPVRATCCLYYRAVADPNPDGEGYCTACPLRTDASRAERWRRHLEDGLSCS